MKYLTTDERQQLAGDYFAPSGLYEYTKSLPFLGRVKSNISTLIAGEWTELLLDYEVGASGLADGAWIKATFKFYSDWALFQTSDPTKDNYVSAQYVPNELVSGQTPATVGSLGIRFDQKGHERPFQKAVIVDIQDGYLNPGDRILIRLGDRRFGGTGTRVQTFIEKDFRWRLYIDPVGTSRFAPIQPDISWTIIAGPPHHIQSVSPRLVQPNVFFAIHAHAEDKWGNVTHDLKDLVFKLRISTEGSEILAQREIPLSETGWTNVIFSDIQLAVEGDYTINICLEAPDGPILKSSISHVSVSSDLAIPKILFGDLHVHSDDTVGTENSVYNFSYGREIAGLDVLGYTANDFQITRERWDATTQLIRTLNEPGKFVIYPGTEWCGNSAAGGDHNVVFLDDSEESPAAFPYDRQGNLARSFEWSEHGPKDLVPGAWPLDEVYATYAPDADRHLLIPHVGGRRCNLAWHHPRLERLVEIGSAWGQFEWLLQDAVQRGWKLGVCANSDEHRGRCGGGVSGTAVFGTRGGLTGILASRLDRATVASSLRSRRTFATTGQRLVGLVSTRTKNDGVAIQGDEIDVSPTEDLELEYQFLGERGFSSIEAFDASGLLWRRHFWSETDEQPAVPAKKILRITWGGARLYDRYREAIWDGRITLSQDAVVERIQPFGGLEDNPEDVVQVTGSQSVEFTSKTSGDIDGVNVYLQSDKTPSTVSIRGSLGGYVKVGDALAGNPHKPQPNFELDATWKELTAPDGKSIEIRGGAGLFVRVEAVPDIQLPRRVKGTFSLSAEPGKARSVYFVGREWSGAKVVTSPLFINYV
ncbi:uncharacterized protein LDX57_008180 [Aspergillus melleus]|uniref:uncharacterized protein n=1 Tax=Aspergillus melleus TaxID=138277 RepID=UPI001E8E94AD|nr:uncharacterized protein LDX57_008180 [Aspergillus melleus]KAH8430518.1 hypothetical protein LDX57_008180 [Aspergillus melleus]